jgi:NodT family efflux transporter outer membrane factor (OMF) lipoprotein
MDILPRDPWRLRTSLAALLVGTALTGCTLGPDFHAPTVDTPSQWGAERSDVPSQTTPDAIDTEWWKSFGDPELTSLVQRLTVQNLDLKTAAERVIQGREQSRVVASQGLPSLDGGASYARERASLNGPISLQQPSASAVAEYDVFQQGLSSSWELDLFGKVRRGVEAADAGTLAAIEARHGIAVAAIAELAEAYLRLRGVQASIAITELNLQRTERNTDLVKVRIGNGYATTLDLAQAQAQQATVAGNLPMLRTQQAALINAMGLLLGEQPRALETELHPAAAQPGVPPRVSVRLPGTLVRQRPDVQEAEARLHAATAETGVAVASFYPDVSLVASFDLQGLQFAEAFSLPARAFQVGPSISIPIFEGGRLRGQLHLRESQRREAAIDFQKTVLRAWQEVDNALTSYAEAQNRRTQVAEAVRQNEIALTAARERYTQGFVDFLNVVTVQGQLLQAQEALAESDTQIATDLVGLYRALGGGWQVTDDAIPK